MAIKFNTRSGTCGSCGTQDNCPDKMGCPPGVCPDFVIRRHDTKPPFKVFVEECEGPLNIQGMVVEVNMWAKGKLKAAIAADDEYFRLSDDIGFEQVMVGDIIIVDRIRLPEHMLVKGFDETNKLIQVERGYHGTTASAWKKGQKLRIFRILNAPAETEIIFEDQTDVDGTVTSDVLVESLLVYQWEPEDTCLPGCYWLEFKLLKMKDIVYFLPGGNWTGQVHQHTDDYFWTGSAHTDSSVRLSYDQVNDLYYLPAIPWTGEKHLYSGYYFTGTDDHDNGSVVLNQTGVASESDVSYDETGLMALTETSVIPSFTDPNLTPADFGCILGEGVEWVRRFPVTGEGFLIKVENSPTAEIS